ncbi:MAG: hypothetical protein WBQ18_07720 [Solirubrobacteraceae bacterium]
MGLLDDAIREHLDLKRRRGADPAEVQRAEREALGPVRRNRDPSDSLDADPAAAEEPGAVAFDQHEHDAEWADHEVVAEHPGDVPEEPIFDDELSSGAETGDLAAPDPAYDVVEPPFDVSERARPPAAAPPPPSAPPQAPVEEDHTWSAADEAEGVGDPFPVAPPPRGREVSPMSDETAEYRVPDALPPEPHDEETGDDVLEETPEFLQDTPDHDRLWFEQRPPKDFDFDG